MARLIGIDIPNNKQIAFSLRYIYGIGMTRAYEICAKAQVEPTKRTAKLDEKELAALREVIMKEGYVLEGDLRRENSMNIKRLMEINSYRGIRHRRGLPTRGQRTKTNARTRKGPRKTVANKKVETK
ncbi:MAG: 30S ribosomal protein S13 [Mycoplasmataceae bacterium]|jgi:small subunit ribosomal protein S13|nr:30S ribosomal protein S13 [Mycoplasmataceae bacterium]